MAITWCCSDLYWLNNTAVMGENAAFYPRLSILAKKYLAKIMHFYSFIPFFIKCTKDLTSALKAYMWTFRREHFSPDFEGPSHQLSKSSAREKNQVQKNLYLHFAINISGIPHLELPRWRKTPRDTNGKGECHIDIQLLVCLTPLQVNWVMVFN